MYVEKQKVMHCTRVCVCVCVYQVLFSSDQVELIVGADS